MKVKKFFQKNIYILLTLLLGGIHISLAKIGYYSDIAYGIGHSIVLIGGILLGAFQVLKWKELKKQKK